MTLRRAAVGDSAAIAALEAAALGVDAWSEGTVRAELCAASITRVALVAERDEQLVGYAVLGVAGESAEVRRIAVAAGSQRCGVGTSLLAELLASARQRGCSEVFLEVHPDNAAAAGLYARFEFAELYRRRRYYADGSDALVLRAPVTC